MLDNIPGNESWKLMQVSVVVADINAAIEKSSALGIGPFDIRTLPPDREEYYRGKPHRGRSLSDASIMNRN